MKAAVFHGVNDIRVQDYETPVPGYGEILLQVKASAICGTDLRIIRNGHRSVHPPAIIGHEISGVVDTLGEGVGEFSVGDKVVVVTPVGCGKCKFCQAGYQNMCKLVSKDVHSLGYYCDGGFAEYMLIPEEAVKNNNLIRFENSSISFEELSLVEPLSCVINGQRFLNIAPGSKVAIFGCGIIGCLHAHLARYLGATPIIMIDNNQVRINLLEKLGIADVLINSSTVSIADTIMAVTEGEGVDIAIVACSSTQAQKSAFEVTGIRGKVSLFGGVPRDERMITIDSNDIHYLEKSVFGAFASAHQQYQEALSLILGKKISLKKLITVFTLEDFKKGLELLARGEVLKVVIKPN